MNFPPQSAACAPADRRCLIGLRRVSALADWRPCAGWLSLGGAVLVMLMLALPGAYGLDPHVQPADYIAKRWDTEQGLPHNAVRALLQTRDGYLWVGTRYGLARFDGLSFTVFNRNNTPAFASNYVIALAETRDGSLWIATSSGLVRYHAGAFTGYSKADGMKSDTINAICEAPDGSLWIGGREGIQRWVDGAFVDDIDTSAYDTEGMRCLDVLARRDIWLSVGSQALRYRDGVFTAFGRAEGIASDRVERIAEDAAGRVYAMTQDGVMQMSGERFVPFEQGPELSSTQMGSALVDRDGNFWIGSVGGLDRVTEGTVASYVDGHGGGLAGVNVLLEDREGCLWVGSSNGLYRVIDRRARTLDLDANDFSGLITTLMESRDGSQWIGSWASGIVKLQGETSLHLTKGSPLSHETITVAYEAPDGTIWLGNRGSAVDRLEGDMVSTFVYPSGVPTSRPVTWLLTDNDGTLLLGIASRGLLELRNGEIVPVPEAADVAKGTVWTLHHDRDRKLLMGTSEGFYERLEDRTWKLIDLPGLKHPVIVRAIVEEPDGGMWLATEGHGVVRWAEGRARSYGSEEGMLDNELHSIVDDGLGSLWVNSARGIARFRKSEFTALDRGESTSLNGMTFGRVDGLLSASATGSGSNSACKLADGRLLFATDQGVAVIDPRSIQTNTLPPRVVIERIIADEQALPAHGNVTLPAGTSKLEIRYTALSLIAPERLRFRYQLEGSDPRWVEGGFNRSAHYTHLAPGNYTFRVLACNNDGVWSETDTALAITLEPYFFQTWWFRLAMIAALAGAVVLIVWLRLRQMSRRQEELTRMNAELDLRVQQRTAELSRSHAELEHRERLFRLIFEHAPVGISWMRADLGSRCHFNATYRRILDLPAQTVSDGCLLAAMIHPDDAPKYAEMTARIASADADSFMIEQRYVRADGGVVWGLLSVAVIRDGEERVIQEIGIMEDVSARKKAEQELAEGNRRMIEVSREAGMAEVATGVLHNVGNVLNSVNVSATLIAERIEKLEIANLTRLSALLQEQGDPGAFLTHDPRGRKVPGFLDTLSGHLASEQKEVLHEIGLLRKNLDHIKEIVAMQQDYARVSGMVEPASVASLVEDALRMNAGALVRHDVTLVRDFRVDPTIEVEKHKVLQILVNLIRNAKYACDDSGRSDKRITVRISEVNDRVRIEVDDNGVGIPAENLTRIFSHGFTTRKNGHGFGLHSGALAAREIGGSLQAISAGAGAGATFILELPTQRALQAA